MKKILWQYYFYKGAVTPNVWTLDWYRVLYSVPTPITPDDYSDKIYTDCVVYVHQNIRWDQEDIEINYNIRIVKDDWSLVDPSTKIYNDPTDINSWLIQNINADASQVESNKGVIIKKPTLNKTELPIIYKDIYLESWDKIIVRSSTPWINVQVFWEELQYDTDAQTLMLRDKLEEVRQEIERTRSIDPLENPLWAAILEQMEREKSIDPLENAFNASFLEKMDELIVCTCTP